jgi:pentose-5-phosphate-3-epimerase
MLQLSLGIVIGVLLSILAVISSKKQEAIEEYVNKLKEKQPKMAVVIKPKTPTEEFLEAPNE